MRCALCFDMVCGDCLRVRSHLKEVQTALEKFRSSELLPSSGEEGEVANLFFYLFLNPIGKSHFLTIIIVLWFTLFVTVTTLPPKTTKQNKTKKQKNIASHHRFYRPALMQKQAQPPLLGKSNTRDNVYFTPYNQVAVSCSPATAWLEMLYTIH